MNGTKQIAIRQVNAQNKFTQSVQEQFGFTQDQAIIIWNVYRKLKLVKVDSIGGQYILTDGRFWDREVMTNALSY